MSDLTWDRVLVYEDLNSKKTREKFLESKLDQKVSVGLYGDALLVAFGGKVVQGVSLSHENLLVDWAHQHYLDQGVDLAEEPSWTGGAFVSYLNKVKEIDIHGSSSTLGGGLPPTVEQVALKAISEELDWLKSELS